MSHTIIIAGSLLGGLGSLAAMQGFRLLRRTKKTIRPAPAPFWVEQPLPLAARPEGESIAAMRARKAAEDAVTHVHSRKTRG